MEFNVADLVEAAADAVPEREALVAGEVRHSFHSLDQRANRAAHHLAENGVTSGDHVGVYAYNCAEYVEAMLACYKLRAVPINVNYRYVEQELQYLFDNADLVAVVHQRQFTPRIAAVRDRLPRETLIDECRGMLLGYLTGHPGRGSGERVDFFDVWG